MAERFVSPRALLNKSGQVTTEYILLVAFIVAILVGVSGILTNQVNEIGEYIETEASEVMSQRTMGIPLNWFLASVGGGFDDGGAGPGGGDPGGGGPGAGGPGGGEAGAGGPGGGPAGTDDMDVPDPNNDGPGGPGSQANNQADFEEESGRSGRGSRRGGGVVYVDGEEVDAGVADDDNNQNSSSAEEEQEGLDEGATDAERRRYALEVEQDRRKSSCEDFDLFKMLKILAIIALIVIGGAYLFTGLGNRGGHKK